MLARPVEAPVALPPGRDSLVVFDREGTTLIKRVVGRAGDTLEMRGARLHRNSRLVAEPYAFTDSSRDTASAGFDWQRSALVAGRDTSAYRASIDDWGPLVVPAHSLFVMGDNRHNSLDSRYTGFVATGDVVGVPRNIYFSRDPEAKRVRWERIGKRLD